MHFSFSDLKLAQLTLDQDHDTPLGHKQSLCKVHVGTSNVSKKRYKPDTNYALFFPMTLNFPNDLGQDHDTLSGHK